VLILRTEGIIKIPEREINQQALIPKQRANNDQIHEVTF